MKMDKSEIETAIVGANNLKEDLEAILKIASETYKKQSKNWQESPEGLDSMLRMENLTQAIYKLDDTLDFLAEVAYDEED
jgi:L-amino acid N-acyltransferase YncA